MSGGSLDYAYRHIETLAADVDRHATKPLHQAFAHHLLKVAKAAYDLECMLSDDTSPGDEDQAILAVLGKSSQRSKPPARARK